jgi:hypothetical protein
MTDYHDTDLDEIDPDTGDLDEQPRSFLASGVDAFKEKAEALGVYVKEPALAAESKDSKPESVSVFDRMSINDISVGRGSVADLKEALTVLKHIDVPSCLGLSDTVIAMLKKMSAYSDRILGEL